jgi:serine/threonine protein kinase
MDDAILAGEQHDCSTGSSASNCGSSSPSAGSRQGGSQAAFRQFFEREIAILASIRHPNVVNFIGACHKPGQRCLVTEYCARGSLDQVLHKSGAYARLLPRCLPVHVAGLQLADAGMLSTNCREFW